jgi:hypothetical protein
MTCVASAPPPPHSPPKTGSENWGYDERARFAIPSSRLRALRGPRPHSSGCVRSASSFKRLRGGRRGPARPGRAQGRGRRPAAGVGEWRERGSERMATGAGKEEDQSRRRRREQGEGEERKRRWFILQGSNYEVFYFFFTTLLKLFKFALQVSFHFAILSLNSL